MTIFKVGINLRATAVPVYSIAATKATHTKHLLGKLQRINVLYIYLMISIALYNLKDGVGTTAAIINLAYLAAADGLKTLVGHFDP
jgi:hypothetical protein